LTVASMDVNETSESRFSIFFLDPGKGISRLHRIERPSDNRAYCERDSCHLSLHTCYQLIACLLHSGYDPHSRCTDAAKQRAVAYLSGRGQMFLQPGADNPSYATALAQQCKCGRFSLPLYETRKITEMSSDGGRGCGLPYPRASRRLHPPVAFPACILTRVPRHWRPGRCPPFCAPMRPRRRPIFQQLGRVAIPGPLSGGRSAIALARSRSPVAPHRPFYDVLGAPLPAMSISQWGPGIGREQHWGPAGDRPPSRIATLDQGM